MYFDDFFMKDMRPATQVYKYCARLLDFCLDDPPLHEEMQQVREMFLTSRPERYYTDTQERESAELRFIDYFLFSYKSEYYDGKTPLEVFLCKEDVSLNNKDRKIFSQFTSNIYSLFEVLKVVVGSHFLAKEVHSDSDKVYKIKENRATYQLEKGDLIIGRVLPYKKNYAIWNLCLSFPSDVAYNVKREWGRMPREERKEFTPLTIEKVFYQAEVREKERFSDLKMVEKKLRRKLHKYLGKKAISIRQLRKKINKTSDPNKIFQELTDQIDFPSEEEYVEFLDLFNAFWNLSSRDEFGGKSPKEKIEEVGTGPLEKQLVQDLISYIVTEISPQEFSSQEKLEEEIEKHKNKWLTEPQPELNNRTPREVILEERKERGNPRKDFSYRINITPIQRKQEAPPLEIQLDEITAEDSPLVEDTESFIRYFRKNKVKATPKNKWIPFKHLKSIEKDFKIKDSFIFLGEEEKRGEEPRKRYIHFIDSVCRAAAFVKLDKKDKITVNENKVREFARKSYGGKLFELFRIWVEEVDWESLQIGGVAYAYSDDHREDFDIFLQHFYTLPVNKKITVEEFLAKVYEPDILSDEDELEDLSIALKKIILDYLKWLGVIGTEEEAIIENSGIFAINKFWVTPAGKKLINRMIIHFIRNGRIQI